MPFPSPRSTLNATKSSLVTHSEFLIIYMFFTNSLIMNYQLSYVSMHFISTYSIFICLNYIFETDRSFTKQMLPDHHLHSFLTSKWPNYFLSTFSSLSHTSIHVTKIIHFPLHRIKSRMVFGDREVCRDAMIWTGVVTHS